MRQTSRPVRITLVLWQQVFSRQPSQSSSLGGRARATSGTVRAPILVPSDPGGPLIGGAIALRLRGFGIIAAQELPERIPGGFVAQHPGDVLADNPVGFGA